MKLHAEGMRLAARSAARRLGRGTHSALTIGDGRIRGEGLRQDRGFTCLRPCHLSLTHSHGTTPNTSDTRLVKVANGTVDQHDTQLLQETRC